MNYPLPCRHSLSAKGHSGRERQGCRPVCQGSGRHLLSLQRPQGCHSLCGRLYRQSRNDLGAAERGHGVGRAQRRNGGQLDGWTAGRNGAGHKMACWIGGMIEPTPRGWMGIGGGAIIRRIFTCKRRISGTPRECRRKKRASPGTATPANIWRKTVTSAIQREISACRYALAVLDAPARLGLGLGAVSCLDGFMTRNTNNSSIYLTHSGDFEKRLRGIHRRHVRPRLCGRHAAPTDGGF